MIDPTAAQSPLMETLRNEQQYRFIRSILSYFQTSSPNNLSPVSVVQHCVENNKFSA